MAAQAERVSASSAAPARDTVWNMMQESLFTEF
jgi:hypothetical protein